MCWSPTGESIWHRNTHTELEILFKCYQKRGTLKWTLYCGDKNISQVSEDSAVYSSSLSRAAVRRTADMSAEKRKEQSRFHWSVTWIASAVTALERRLEELAASTSCWRERNSVLKYSSSSSTEPQIWLNYLDSPSNTAGQVPELYCGLLEERQPGAWASHCLYF